MFNYYTNDHLEDPGTFNEMIKDHKEYFEKRYENVIVKAIDKRSTVIYYNNPKHIQNKKKVSQLIMSRIVDANSSESFDSFVDRISIVATSIGEKHDLIGISYITKDTAIISYVEEIPEEIR